MGRLSNKLRSVEGGRVGFWCPGCKEMHVVRVDPAQGSAWGYNGNPDMPTFTTSILVTGAQVERDESGKWTGEWKRDATGKVLPQRCHTYVTDGQIQFLADCLHSMAGQTVPMPDLPEGDFDGL